MTPPTHDVRIRVIDLEPVQIILEGAGDLAKAVERALEDDNLDNTRGAEILRGAVADFRATVLAQSEAAGE